ncbi:hypothetical protein MFIFM68171_00934 [Madurella fahalii]|uniref:Secreted protein n=1 Tax=Madurella fahalii TaxID=1157608 RepID=A0ABQ0FZ74_9PEZI
MGLLVCLTVLLAVASPSLVSAEAPAAPAAPAVSPRITSISYSGNGCLQDPKQTGSLNDATFTYHNFALSMPGGNQTLNCQVHVQANGVGSGWQMALSRNRVNGHVVLSPGTALTHYTTVYFSQDASNTGTLRGSVENDGKQTMNQAVTLVSEAGGSKVWSQCTGSDGYIGILNVNFRGALTGSGKAYFEALSENWDVEWRRC